MASPKVIKAQLEKARDNTIGKFGLHSASLGNERFKQRVVPSPSLMLDYMLGIGGFPYNHMVEVFGGNGLGKTSALGYGTLANVQRQGKLPALVAMEPVFDAEWAHKLHGLDPDLLLINRPNSAEEAFAMIYDLVYDGLVDYILIDSIGAMASESEVAGGGKKAYGASGVITSGFNVISPRAYKNNVGIMAINQQRQKGAFQGNILYESPGGEGLKHHAMIRIHLKPGRERYTATVDGEKVIVGRELTCVFLKNKLAMAVNKKASFNFFHIETPEYGLGIDKTQDIINVGKLTRVIEGQYRHPSFPEGKLASKAKVADFLHDNPQALEAIRKDVIKAMNQRELKAAEEKALREKAVDQEETIDTEEALA